MNKASQCAQLQWLVSTNVFTDTLQCWLPFTIYITPGSTSWHVICSLILLMTRILNYISRQVYIFPCIDGQNVSLWCFTGFCKMKQS